MIIISDEDFMECRLNLGKLMAWTGTSKAVGEILKDPSPFLGDSVLIPLPSLRDEVEF